MKVLVTGAAGQLGHDVLRALAARGVEAVGAARADMPMTEPQKLRAFFRAAAPDAVVHCAAYTAVDRAEDEPALCYAVNAAGTRALAEACEARGAKLVYVSTDYVFPGTGEAFYETDDKTGPCNVYGASKRAGERAVQAAMPSGRYFIVRTSWIFGVNGKNFIRTILRLAETRDTLTVVDDQIGSPTYSADLAELLAGMTRSGRYGIYHAANEGVCSWAALAAEAIRLRGLGARVAPVPSEAYPTRAARPKNSRLSMASLDRGGFRRLPAWQDAVRRYLTALSERAEAKPRA